MKKNKNKKTANHLAYTRKTQHTAVTCETSAQYIITPVYSFILVSMLIELVSFCFLIKMKLYNLVLFFAKYKQFKSVVTHFVSLMCLSTV